MQLRSGFTVIELMVSITIMTLIMSVVLLSYSRFNGDLALSAMTQEVSLAIRQAQTYGLSVKETVAGGGQFNSGYGFYVNPSDPTHYYVFVDTNANEKYDPGSGCGSGSTECVEMFSLRNGVTITGICGAAFSGSMQCPPGVSIQSMHVTFLRPNPDADIRFANSGNVLQGGAYQAAQVTLTSPQGGVARVTVESTGQISVQ